MQCTAQRQQKVANTSLLESRNLLQTATLVFPRHIVCSRLSNNINILAKKFFRPPTGGMAPPAPAASATAYHAVIRGHITVVSALKYSVLVLYLGLICDLVKQRPNVALAHFSLCTNLSFSVIAASLGQNGEELLFLAYSIQLITNTD